MDYSDNEIDDRISFGIPLSVSLKGKKYYNY